MGGVSSKDQVAVTTNAFIDVANSAVQKLSTISICNQGIVVSNCKTVNITDVTEDCINYTSGTSVLTADMKTSIDQDFKNIVAQQAKAINQNASLNPSSTEASTTTTLVTNLGQSINNSFTNTCDTKVVSNQAIVISDCTDLNIERVSLKALQQNFTSCVGNDTSVIDAKQALENHITQISSATVQDAIAAILMALAFCLLAYAVVKGGGIGSFSGKGSGTNGSGGKSEGGGHMKLIITLIMAFIFYIFTYFNCMGLCKTDIIKYISYAVITLLALIIIIL